MNIKKLIIVAVIALLIGLFYGFDLHQHLSLEAIKSQQQSFANFYQQNPSLALGAFFIIYVLATALSLPGAALLTLLGGALFGLVVGTLVISFASTIGASLAFIISRYLLRDGIQSKFSKQLKTINAGIEKEGAFYLFTMRLVPIFPFFLINIIMGLTNLRLSTFYWVSQVGMLAGTLVYVNAGTQLAQLESAGDILSFKLILSFCLLGIFPLIAKKIVDYSRQQQALKKFDKPKHFDTNMVVIGGGSAGLIASLIAAAIKAKVTLIEKHKMGGDCLNTGCVPSKALLRSAKIAHYNQRAAEFGVKNQGEAEVDFPAVMQRVHKVIASIEPHDSVERFTGLGVDCEQGEAKIISPYCVEVNGKRITTKNIVIATGARPFVPPIEGLEQVNYLTSDNLWQLTEQPKKLLILGGGAIGCELSQAFSRLGSEVTQIEQAPRLMQREDPEVSQLIEARFRAAGIQVLTGHQALRVEAGEQQHILHCQHEGQEVALPFDQIIVAVGRKANIEGFGLEKLGIETTPRGTVEVNEYLQTNIPNIYACGDVAGPYQFTHMASHQAWYATVNSLFGRFYKAKVNYKVVPWATFTDPEVARVGINETEAKAQELDHQVHTYELDDLDRAIADGETQGFVKVITAQKSDKILGVTIVGYHAAEMLNEFILAMTHGLGLNKILGTIHIYPTLSEANKMTAGLWKKANAPQKVLQWLGKYHRWNRNAKSKPDATESPAIH